jgi:hypothetical protein
MLQQLLLVTVREPLQQSARASSGATNATARKKKTRKRFIMGVGWVSDYIGAVKMILA